MSLRDALAAPASVLWRLAAPVVPRPAGAFHVLMFHDIPSGQRESFRVLVEGLARAGRLISPAEAEGRLAGGGPNRGLAPVLLSFDDGFASNLAVAETVLAPLGAKALFFVCPGLIELSGEAQAEAVSRNVLRGQRAAPEPLMDWAGIERLRALGHTIGNHTRDHLRLAGLPADQRAEQIEGAAGMLAARLGAVPDWFAYTFGDIASIDAAALAEIGRHHRYCRSGVRGANGRGTPPLALRGDHVDLAASRDWQALACDGALALLYGKQRRMLDGLAPTPTLPRQSRGRET
ncbi:hypothetical protein A6A04_03620 [Paramagnetospirillum marisnigri]|uniref:Chitooligosaccharide deacetylase n=1 Tax=Paramagnetospirillum marisnigri TaxID=1285242 RepID=A0A178MKY7_9PROT|nr:polysaccharide deacetylase family protein [Paramagnetospirillum marisnigri]OAN49213.1 hypothetical protein A6A04_03620 [Paramagnetospirillum marisnigri]